MMTGVTKKEILNTLITARPVIPPFFIHSALRMIRMGYLPTGEKRTGRIIVSKYKGGADAACCISVDFDSTPDDSIPEKPLLNHEGTLALLELADRYEIPITWAICGGTALRDQIAFNQILHSQVHHEIGLHTFNHRDLADPSCSDEEAEFEIRKCIDTLNLTRKPTTFVFPWNREAKYHILKNQGITAYRSKNRLICYPRKEHGLWNIPPVCYLDWNTFGRIDLIERFIDLCISYNSVFHMWTHPWSLSVNGNVRKYFNEMLEPVFRYIAEMRDNGRLWVCTLGQLADYCEAREKCKISDYVEDEHDLRFKAMCYLDDPRFTQEPELNFRVMCPNRRLGCSVETKEMAQLGGMKTITHSTDRTMLSFNKKFTDSENSFKVRFR
jgi:peptidoglycan/xylan/chitin deacetylase (PgdA/CDA1 family)